MSLHGRWRGLGESVWAVSHTGILHHSGVMGIWGDGPLPSIKNHRSNLREPLDFALPKADRFYRLPARSAGRSRQADAALAATRAARAAAASSAADRLGAARGGLRSKNLCLHALRRPSIRGG